MAGDAGPPDVRAVDRPEAAPGVASGRGRVLVADDDARMRHHLQRILGEHWSVDTVGDGRAALAAIRRRPPDVVVAEAALPGLDGVELLDAIRDDPATRRVPVILLSARAGEDETATTLEAGADDYVVTPFQPSELVARVRLHLELARLRRRSEQTNIAKTDFLARISHELRTPLNAVLGFAQLLHLDERRADQRRHLDHVLRAGRHLAELLDDLLDLTKLESGDLVLEREPVVIRDVLEAAVGLVEPMAGAAGVHVRLDDVPPAAVVDADRLRLQDVFLNLLSNGVKFNHQGGEVSVRAQNRDGSVRIAVRDTGIGIAADDLDRLFEPFDRLRAPAGVEGSGLGLALTRRVVEALGGTLEADSRPGEGSTFWLELPASLDGDIRPDDDPVAESSTAPDAPRILCVEDNLLNLRLLERTLGRRPGVEVLTARTGHAGLQLASSADPDLILLDLQLPDLDGEAVMQRLARQVRTRSIPVVVVSADATPDQIERMLAAGAYDYITKPYDIAHVLDVVDRALAPGPRS